MMCFAWAEREALRKKRDGLAWVESAKFVFYQLRAKWKAKELRGMKWNVREVRGTFPLRGKKARIFILLTARKIEGERTPWKEIECEKFVELFLCVEVHSACVVFTEASFVKREIGSK